MQKLPGDYKVKLLDFQRFIIRQRKNFNYDLSQLSNAIQHYGQHQGCQVRPAEHDWKSKEPLHRDVGLYSRWWETTTLRHTQAEDAPESHVTSGNHRPLPGQRVDGRRTDEGLGQDSLRQMTRWPEKEEPSHSRQPLLSQVNSCERTPT